ncbi:hypothetical protein LPJ59_004702, partial [Coemansia sp. RSA 2399]
MVPFTASDGTPLLMLFGGSDSLDANDPLSVAANGTSMLNILDIADGKWYAPQTADAPTEGPVLPGCGAKQGSIWVYDPHYGVTSEQSSPVSLLDSVHWSWSSPTEQGQLPITRFGAAFAYVPTSDQFFMHGGIPLSGANNEADDPPGIANNLDILSPSDLSWAYASNGPARKYHSLCYIKSIDSIILFGGSDQNIASYNDVKSYSVNASSWSYSLDVGGDIPSERVLHSAVCTDDSMLVFGGTHTVGDSPSDSTVWVLKANNESSFTWSAAPISSSSLGESPSARFGHSMNLYNNSVYIYGGIGPSGRDDTVYVLDVNKWEWSQIAPSNSNSKDGGDGVNTRVLIAAVVSSVLGIVCVGIAGFVFYRWNRRRGTAQEKKGGPVTANDMPDSSEYSASGNAIANGETVNGKIGADGYVVDRDSHQDVMCSTRVERSNGSYINQYEDANYLLMLGNSGSTAAHGKRNSDIVANNYMPTPHANQSVGSSTSVGSFSVPATNSNTPIKATYIEPHNESKIHRHSATNSTPIAPNGHAQDSSADRRSSAYAQVEVINDLLLSGNPLPAWLREAVRRSDSEHNTAGDLHKTRRAPNVSLNAGAEPEKQTSANDHDYSTPRDTADIDSEQQSGNRIVTRRRGNSADRMQEMSSIHSTETNNTQSAPACGPIKYMTASPASTDTGSIHNGELDDDHQGITRPRKYSDAAVRTRHYSPELSDADFSSAGLQSDIAARDVLAALSSSIARPMSPPVPLHMNMLYGELGNRGIIVGEAAIPRAYVATSHVSLEEGIPREDKEEAAEPNGSANSRRKAEPPQLSTNNEILSPLDRLARYHALDSWMAEGTTP